VGTMIYSLSTAATPAGVCVSLSGEVDVSVSDHLYQALVETLDQTVGPVEVSLRELSLLDLQQRWRRKSQRSRLR
jgi:hypothetical protein